MKISYQWLSQYFHFDLSPEEAAKYLTSSGLEVEGIELYQSIRGGLRGLVIGEVLTCEPHPDSDHLHLTTVNVGGDTPLNVVCGAPNVAAGQKVIVATIGTTLYNGDESFTIKKSKIRGAVSEGMICAEDEIGVGTSHDGIMVLDDSAVPGTPAADYFKIEDDYIFEIGLTPNRSDAISHYGVARDLYAMLKTNNIPCSPLLLPNNFNMTPIAKTRKIDIVIDNRTACPRYTGLTLGNVKVKESPEWLKTRLRSIGVRPVNNVVDITQFVMFEIGQPMHAFDADKIKGDKVIIKNLPEGTPFVTLDGNEIKLSADDLMICNAEEPMCIAGVYGGLDSGITENTCNVFLESAYFNPVSVRKTSKRHNLKTDAAFRFERGCDPDITTYAIKRAAQLLTELADAMITSEIVDVYPTPIEHKKITISLDEINRLAGKELNKHTVSSILLALGMEVEACGEETFVVDVPLFRADVTRPVDLVEEILRIYGYNNIEIPTDMTYDLSSVGVAAPSRRLKNIISTYLADNGFFEVMNNSLTKAAYAEKFDFLNADETIKLLNPLSSDLNALRQSVMISGLENIAHNLKNKTTNLRLFEFGKHYIKNTEAKREDDVTTRFKEETKLSLFVTGKFHDDIWNDHATEMDFFYLKNIVFNIFKKANYPIQTLTSTCEPAPQFIDHIAYQCNGQTLVQMGQLHPRMLKEFDIKKPVYYAEIDLATLYCACGQSSICFTAIPVHPAVKRDLALVVDKNISYEMLEAIATKFGGKLLKSVSLFDVYEGDKIESGKKSYALNFVLQHAEKTLTDEEINKVMNKLIAAFEREIGAKLR